ncbi:MAG: replication initiator protein [Microviridae sp.]|nr:MAG: replication initiator protein [Microviridae sp.]
MCLYSKLARNKKYEPNKKNGGRVPAVTHPGTMYVAYGCGECMECRKQKAREWQVRMQEDIKTNTNAKLVTLTFSNESISEIIRKVKNPKIKGYLLDNWIATYAVRHFVERWRKKHKKSVRHWLITELGHQATLDQPITTEHIHMHGLIWTDEPYAEIREKWNYGYIWPRPEVENRTYVNAKTINYNIKYVHKQDLEHPGYKPIILTSPGIGANYVDNYNVRRNRFNWDTTEEYYITDTGHKIAMPTYWRNKIYNDDEREWLWIKKLEKQERYVGGEKVDISRGYEGYFRLLKWYRQRNQEMGYGDGKVDWDKKEIEEYIRQMKIMQRTKKE